MGSVEQRPALRGLNPCVVEFEAWRGHQFVRVDLQPDQRMPIGHLFIPENKVPHNILDQIATGQVEALALNEREGSWEIADVQLRSESGSK